jgi:hypothetical protein
VFAAATGSIVQTVVLSVVVAFIMVPISVLLPRLVAHSAFKSKNVEVRQQLRLKYAVVRKSWRQKRLGLSSDVTHGRRFQPASLLPLVKHKSAVWMTKEQYWAILMSVCFVQACVGFFAACYGVFIAASGSNRSITLLPLILCGSVAAALAQQAFVNVNKMRWTLAAVLLCASLLVEAVCALLMSLLHLPGAQLLLLVVGGLQLLSLLLVCAFGLFDRWHQRASRKAAKLASTRLLFVQEAVTAAVAGTGDAQARVISAARIIMRAFHAHHYRVKRARRRDFEAWSAVVSERRILQVLTYMLLTLLGVILALFNLVYGATFTNEQNGAWITRVISSLLISTSYFADLGVVDLTLAALPTELCSCASVPVRLSVCVSVWLCACMPQCLCASFSCASVPVVVVLCSCEPEWFVTIVAFMLRRRDSDRARSFATRHNCSICSRSVQAGHGGRVGVF